MKKVILKLDLHDDDKAKQKAMKMVSSLTGLDSITMDMKEKKLTVEGNIDLNDLIRMVIKLRKVWYNTKIVSVGPKKEAQQKQDEKGKKEEEDEKKDPNEQIAELMKLYKSLNPHMTTHYYVQSLEEDPNACVIC